MIADILCFVARLVSGLTIRWQGCVPDTGQRIYFANHTSHLDFLIIWASLPKSIRLRTRPVAAKEYWSKGKIRRYLSERVINAVLISRSDTYGKSDHPIEAIVQVLEEGYSLIFFPEGTRSMTGEMKPFKSGLYHIMRHYSQAEYIPVYLENLSRILPKGEFLPVPLLGSITFGEPFAIQEQEAKKETLARAFGAVKTLGEVG